MKKLGDKTLNTIEKLLVKSSRPKQSEPSLTKSKSKSPHRLTKSPIKAHSRSHHQQSGHNCELSTYLGEKEIKCIARQKKLVYEIEGSKKFKVENPVSFYYNQKNPRAPIYERAQQISMQKEAVLQEKRE